MEKITTAVFEPGSTTANVYGLWQYDYGQALRIQGLHLPSAVEIHFSLQESGGTSVSRVGVTKDGVTDVIIPDSMLENDGADKTYDMFAFIYLTDDTSGQTEYKIKLQVKSRPKPEAFDGGENPNIFHEAVQAVQKSADQAAESEKHAEGWAHGRKDLPERAQDNAKYYSDQTAADAKKTEADRKEVERLVESVSDIDQQVTKVENLTKQAQTSATNAALSEQAAKTAESNAQTAQAGAETAEGNAELAERNAKASEQAVEKAKQIITQMGQEVLNNKNHVDQTVQVFDQTAQKVVADVNNAGQAQTERVQDTGNTAVESVKTAQTAATKAVETAKTEAVETVQTEGITQTGNVSAEGEKQVQAVQAAAQEIVADREQIQKNKAGIEALKQGKADAIVETASGEIIQVEDSSGLGFEGLRIFGKSTQDGVPSPESPVPIANVGDKGTIEIGVTGKNLLKPLLEPEVQGAYVGWKIKNNDETITISIIDKAPDVTVPSGLAVGLTGSGVDASKGVEWLVVNGEIKKTSVSSRLKYFSIYPKNAIPTVVEKYDIQIEYGTSATEYEPYTNQSLALSTPNGLPGVKVDSDGNYTDENGQQWICDEIDLERGKYVQRTIKIIFDGSGDEEWKIYAQEKYAGFLIENALPEASMRKRGYCNIAVVKTNSSSSITDGIWIGVNNKIIYYANNPFYNISLSDKGLANWKKYLNENPMEIITYLTQPIEHDLTPEEIAAYKALHTNYPTTVISNDESAHMEVSYVADTKHYIASKIETPLQKQITDLQNALISQKISGGGIKVTDSVRVPVVKLSMWGKTEQVRTTGAQLFDASKIPTIEEGEITLKYDGNGSLVLNGRGNVNVRYDYSHEETAKLLKPGKLTFLDKNNNNIGFGFMQACIFVDGKEVYTAYINGNAISLPEEELNNPTTFLQLLCYTVQSDATYNNVIFKPMLYQDGNGEWEPFTDGKPAPAPDNPAPIEVTAHPVTVSIKGGTEQQSITLVPPRPLTKWDKLEKVEGVWQWVYQSRWIESYVDENITGEYISTTGGLNAGAKVCYKSTSEYIPLPQPVQDKLNALTMYAGTTEIINDGGCTMELTYTVDTQSYVDKKIAEISKAIL